MIVLPLVTLALGLPLQASAQASFAPPTLQTLESRLADDAHAADPNARLLEVTDPLVGAPYVLNPLGEGDGADPDPRLRLDAFDCTTFVETGIAMSLATSADDVLPTLDIIRYRQASPHFNNRRHFPAAQWLPDLIAMGVLEDVTRQVAGPDAQVAKKTLDLAAWDKRDKKILADLDRDAVPQGAFTLDVWPIQLAKKGYKRIPPGTVLSVVRSDRPSVPVRVSHQGLIIEKDGKLFLRHAARKVYGRVVDEPLSWFLARNAKYKKWPVTGIHLARVRPAAEARKQVSASKPMPPAP